MRKYLDKLAVALLSISLFLLLSEILSAALLPVLRINHGHVSLGVDGKYVLEYPRGYLKDRDLFWRLEPLCGDRNSIGLRDREIPLLKSRNTFRVICMGDSVTVGYPAPVTDTYPKALERILQKKFPGYNIEVFNFGVPGYTSYQGRVLLKKAVFGYNPDLIVVYYGVNDRTAAYKSDKEQPGLPSWAVNTENFLHNSAFYRLFMKLALYFKYPPQKDKNMTVNRVSPDDYRNNLKDIAEEAGARGVKSFFIVNPAFYDPLKHVVFTDERYYFREKFPKLDVYSFFKENEKDCSVFFLDDIRPFNFHLTQKGQDFLAKGVCEALLSSGISIRPKDQGV